LQYCILTWHFTAFAVFMDGIAGFFIGLAQNAAELLKKYLIEHKYAKKIGSELAAHGRSLYYGRTLR